MYKRKILLNNKYKSMKSNCLMKTVNKIAFVVLFLLCISPCFALPDGYEDRYIDDFRYGLFVPPGYDPSVKYHLILYLHGYTDTTSWNFQWYTKEFQSKFPALVLSPKCLVTYTEGWGNSWNMVESYAIKMAFRALDSTLKYYNIDTTRMHVCGTSMGGFGTFYVLARYPGRFASAYSICGGGNPATAPLPKNTPLWIFHGDADPVVPVASSRNVFNALLEAGSTHVRYTEYPGVQHNSWENANRESTLDTWLFSQQLGSVHGNPDPVKSFTGNLDGNLKPSLKWEPPADQSTEDKKIWCYRIYRDAEMVAVLDKDSLSYTDHKAASDTEYTYSIRTVNYFFSESAASTGIAFYILPLR
jgi:pimeloyl-ACP methyl ester carboxylesterase